MHARQIAYSITNHEFNHADHTPENIYAVRNKYKERHFWYKYSEIAFSLQRKTDGVPFFIFPLHST
jgi:hypothetical protein